MRLEDVTAVAGLEAQSFSTPWSAESFRTLVEGGIAEVWVAETGSPDRSPDGEVRLAGYAVAWFAGDSGELANLAVRPDLRGKGVGSALLDYVLHRARSRGIREMFLEVRASNEAAVRLYRSRGFRRVAVRSGYYPNPREDALVYRLSLNEPGRPGSDRNPSG